MLRKSILAGIGVMAAVVALMGSAENAQAFFDDPYIPFCRSGYCGGGDFYLGGCWRGWRARRSSQNHLRYYGTPGATSYPNGMGYSQPAYQTSSPPTPSVTQPSTSR